MPAAQPERVATPFGPVERDRLRRALARGETMAFPTETSYALGGNALLEPLAAAIYRLKGRRRDQPLLLLVDGAPDVERWAGEVPPAARVLMERFWPGPLTLVFRAAPHLPPHLADGRGTVALRWSPHPVVAELLRIGGVPLIGTSANRSGSPALHTADAVRAAFPGEPLLCVDGGATAEGPPSTVLDVTLRPFRVLRPGAIAPALLGDALRARFPELSPA
jgi:L-threonylcarbamoyladenylate synthase